MLTLYNTIAKKRYPCICHLVYSYIDIFLHCLSALVTGHLLADTKCFNSVGFGIEEIIDGETSDPNEEKADIVSKAESNTGLVSALKPVTINMPEMSTMPSTWSTPNGTLVEDAEEIPVAPRLKVHNIYSSSQASNPGEPKEHAAAM